jgi:hypothetical protein
MLMLVVLIGMALAAIMVPLVITQTHTTTFDSGRGRALHAAESGIDLALGQVRAAVDDGAGDVTQLPCGPLTGSLGNVGSYSVDIAYYTGNPVGHDDAWLDSRRMACAPGYGVWDTETEVNIPSYILLTSTGTEAGTGDTRTLSTTYVVSTTDMAIPGGQIRLYPSGATNYCLTVSLPAANGALITLQPCQDPVPDSQKFAYADQLGIQLVASGDDKPLCLKTDGSSGKELELGPCGTDTQAPWIEMWGFDNDSHFRVADPNQKSLSNLCFGAQSPPTETPPYAKVDLTDCSGNYQDPKQAWIPSPYVGAGGAGRLAGQLVNFFQFGRCLDVTNHDVSTGTDAGGTFLIAYGCMQVPNQKDAPVPPWDQVFEPSVTIDTLAPPTKSRWVVTCPSGGDGACQSGQQYCLTSSGTTGQYATVTPCDKSGNTESQIWTRYQTVDTDGTALGYDDKYTIKDAGGLCLSLGKDSDMFHDFYFKVTTDICDGTTKQKWNAEATVQDPEMENLHEK